MHKAAARVLGRRPPETRPDKEGRRKKNIELVTHSSTGGRGEGLREIKRFRETRRERDRDGGEEEEEQPLLSEAAPLSLPHPDNDVLVPAS